MSPFKEYEAKVLLKGSCFYYSLLKLPSEQKNALVALFALCQEIQKIPQTIKEPTVARAKLQWWAEELEFTYQKKPRHPITKVLSPAIMQHQLPKQLFEELLLGTELILDVDHCCSEQDFLLYGYREQGIRTLLAAYLAGFTHHDTIKFAHELGIALTIISHIQELRHAIQKGRVYFPLEAFARVQLNPASLKELQESPALFQLLQEEASKAHQHYNAALAKLPAQDMKAQQYNLVYAALKMALLDVIEKEGFPVLQYRIELTPLQNYWLSQKKRRQIQKNSRT